MNAREFRAGVNSRAEHVRRLVAVCGTGHVRQWVELKHPMVGFIQTGESVPVRTNSRGLSLRIREWWAAGDEHLLLTGCHYVLLGTVTGQELLAFHRHEGRFPDGHYHLGPASGELLEPLTRAHLPAPQLDLESFVLMLITEFRVRPRRADWESVLRGPGPT
ncbi:MAG: hypothetical protein IH609_09680 [Dehalococcoidia bacterium]|nr:hypothetical protein [Dehalococcoidia bacterium]